MTELTGNKKRVYDFVQENGPCKTAEVVDGVGRARGYVYRMLDELRDGGQLVRINVAPAYGAQKIYAWAVMDYGLVPTNVAS